jgi:nucleosome binding factor SPN SPT16 subunit
MVFIQPSVKCLVNLTETPTFLIDLDSVEHVHFERVTYATKAFDVTFIFKDLTLTPKTITAIEMKSLETIQDWLNDVNITYTSGPASVNWGEVLQYVREEGEYFYLDEDENGDPKEVGWQFLCIDGAAEGEEEEDDDESSFEADSDDDSSSEDSEDDDSDFEDEDDDSDDYDPDEDLEEEGKARNISSSFIIY